MAHLSEVLPAPLGMHLLYTYLLLHPTCHLRSAPHTSAWRSLLQKSFAQPYLALIIEQHPLLGPRIAVATITESLYPFGFVTLGDLPYPLLASLGEACLAVCFEVASGELQPMARRIAKVRVPTTIGATLLMPMATIPSPLPSSDVPNQRLARSRFPSKEKP